MGEMTVKVSEHSAAMEEANLRLRTEIGERNKAERQLEKTRDAAVKASRTKSEFLANMSHEIRTPMNAIIGMNDLLWETPLNPEQLEYVRVSRSAGDTLMTLINDILDLSKVEAGKVTLEAVDFDLEELLDNTGQFFSKRSHDKGLELSCHIAPGVPTALIGDPLYLRQVITNLVSNAIKYTENGEVVLRVERDPDASDPGALIFRVSDTGMGIPPEKVETIFDSFTQVESALTREYGGTGLGLSISRKLVELMGGRIWVESIVQDGSTFNFTARFGVQPAKNGRSPLPLEEMKLIRTLVVDDNANNRVVVADILAAWGVPAREVADGYQALVELVRAHREGNPYKLVLLDRVMPGQDGFQVARSVRYDLGLDEVTIIMLTSDSRSEDALLCQELGIANHLIKPIRRSALLHAITTSLGLIQVSAESNSAPVVPDEAPSLTDQDPLKILLVDDSADNRLLVQAYMKNTPHHLEMAENGQEAVDKFTTSAYDVVLMDIQMPVMDGYAATREIRKWELRSGGGSVSIIGLKAHALKDDAQKSADAGCTAHLTKPVKKAALLEAIHHYARRAESCIGPPIPHKTRR